jgi:MFS family permease
MNTRPGYSFPSLLFQVIIVYHQHQEHIERAAIRKFDIRVLFAGLIPVFMLAHFGHHVVGAMLRPLMPMIRTDFNLSYTQSGFVLSAFAITAGFSQLPAGWLADRFGARIMVVISVSGVALAGLLIGLSHSYVALVAFLVVAALLGGGYHPAAAAAISASVPSERRGRALGLHLIGGSSTFWVVPLIAAPIALVWGWRGPYISLTVPVIILGIVLYFLIGHRIQASAPQVQAVTSEDPAAPGKIRWRKLLPFLIMTIATGTMIQSVSSYFSLYAVDYLGVSETVAALLVSVTPAVGLFAAPLGGYVSDRVGGVPVLVVVSFAAIPLIYLLGVVTNVLALVAVMVVIGIVSNTRMPTSEAYLVGNTPPHRRSTILGLYFFAGAEASGLLTPVVGTLIDHVGFSW